MAPAKRKSAGEGSSEPKKAKPVAAAAAAAPKKKAGALAVGDNVVSVAAQLLTEDERTVTLADITQDEGVIIFMYPRANTGGCTKQACGFKDNYAAIQEAGFGVYGLSFDKPKSQGNWKSKYSLPYHLLTDDGTVLKAFGAFKQPKNISRSHVVIAKGGEMLEIRNGISPGDSFAEALKTVRAAATKGGK